MFGHMTNRLRSIAATRMLSAFVVLAAATSSFAAPPRPLAGALPPGHPSCHVLVVGATELASHPDRRVSSITLARSAADLAAERKWGAFEQFDDTPVVSATLRVRLRGDPVTHAAHLECTEGDDSALVCTSPACAGGEIRISAEGKGAIGVSLGGVLQGGAVVDHYIHLDQSCEGRVGGPVVLQSGHNERRFSLLPSPNQACQ
jgi:hypothetical protein